MDGTTPAYRTLTYGIGDGPDVLALNRNLVRLGFDPDGIVVDDVWRRPPPPAWTCCRHRWARWRPAA